MCKTNTRKDSTRTCIRYSRKGIVLAGGGALIQNLDKLLSIKTEMPVYVAENPLECVVKGTEKTIEDLEKLKSVLINGRRRK